MPYDLTESIQALDHVHDNLVHERSSATLNWYQQRIMDAFLQKVQALSHSLRERTGQDDLDYAEWCRLRQQAVTLEMGVAQLDRPSTLLPYGNDEMCFRLYDTDSKTNEWRLGEDVITCPLTLAARVIEYLDELFRDELFERPGHDTRHGNSITVYRPAHNKHGLYNAKTLLVYTDGDADECPPELPEGDPNGRPSTADYIHTKPERDGFGLGHIPSDWCDYFLADPMRAADIRVDVVFKHECNAMHGGAGLATSYDW
jgi:hypothetical protein